MPSSRQALMVNISADASRLWTKFGLMPAACWYLLSFGVSSDERKKIRLPQKRVLILRYLRSRYSWQTTMPLGVVHRSGWPAFDATLATFCSQLMVTLPATTTSPIDFHTRLARSA